MALSYLPFTLSCAGAKVDHSISIEKCMWVSKGVSIQDFNNIIHDFCIFLYHWR